MPKCVFCGEWAGPETDQHELCRMEFEKSVSRPRLYRRGLDLASRLIRSVALVMSRPFERVR